MVLWRRYCLSLMKVRPPNRMPPACLRQLDTALTTRPLLVTACNKRPELAAHIARFLRFVARNSEKKAAPTEIETAPALAAKLLHVLDSIGTSGRIGSSGPVVATGICGALQGDEGDGIDRLQEALTFFFKEGGID